MNSKSKKISIIIVNYNTKDFLFQCIKSIEKGSKNLNVEVIVVDNNSSDNSVDFLTPIFPEVNFIDLKENLGFPKANNIGASHASGDYLLILNPDTLLEEDTLSVMLDYMENNPGVGASGCKVLNSDGSFQLACRRGFPTPWSSFCKLFGLQSIFPKSRLFAQYNQTFRSIDETYSIDSLIGAFMFVRRTAWDEINGFDEDYFMYGEDIDLCYQLKQKNWDIIYLHTTSIIHYKGVSTKRSNINELKHFYESMKIFSSKHYASSSIFFSFLKLGISLRGSIAKMMRYKLTLLLLVIDIISINLSLIIATKIRFGGYFNFPDYAYPTVFLVLSVILITSMISIGEYFEGKPSFRKALSGLLITFFILSALTYFFKNYAFSRGIVLMTIGFSIVSAYISRSFLSFLIRKSRSNPAKNLAILGTGQEAVNIYNSIINSNIIYNHIKGFIAHNNASINDFIKDKVIGYIDYLPVILEENEISELIICDKSLSSSEVISIIKNSSDYKIKFHIAFDWDDIVAARIINDISGQEPTVPDYNLSKFRYKILKRFSDIIISLFTLTIGLPIVYLFLKNPNSMIKNLISVLMGKISIVGTYPGFDNIICKKGITGLVHLSNPDQLSLQAINRLNEYYLMNYTFSLDLEIILRNIFRK